MELLFQKSLVIFPFLIFSHDINIGNPAFILLCFYFLTLPDISLPILNFSGGRFALCYLFSFPSFSLHPHLS